MALMASTTSGAQYFDITMATTCNTDWSTA
jgi:hypothetical protein